MGRVYKSVAVRSQHTYVDIASFRMANSQLNPQSRRVNEALKWKRFLYIPARFGVAMVILPHFFVHKPIFTCHTYFCTCVWANGWPVKKTIVSFNDEIIINMRDIIARACLSTYDFVCSRLSHSHSHSLSFSFFQVSCRLSRTIAHQLFEARASFFHFSLNAIQIFVVFSRILFVFL